MSDLKDYYWLTRKGDTYLRKYRARVLPVVRAYFGEYARIVNVCGDDGTFVIDLDVNEVNKLKPCLLPLEEVYLENTYKNMRFKITKVSQYNISAIRYQKDHRWPYKWGPYLRQVVSGCWWRGERYEA